MSCFTKGKLCTGRSILLHERKAVRRQHVMQPEHRGSNPKLGRSRSPTLFNISTSTCVYTCTLSHAQTRKYTHTHSLTCSNHSSTSTCSVTHILVVVVIMMAEVPPHYSLVIQPYKRSAERFPTLGIGTHN